MAKSIKWNPGEAPTIEKIKQASKAMKAAAAKVKSISFGGRTFKPVTAISIASAYGPGSLAHQMVKQAAKVEEIPPTPNLRVVTPSVPFMSGMFEK